MKIFPRSGLFANLESLKQNRRPDKARLKRPFTARPGIEMLEDRLVPAAFTVNTVAGNGTAGYSGDGGLALAAELNGPGGVAVDVAGDLFIADYNNNVIREVSATGVITIVAGNGSFGCIGDSGPATAAQLNGPAGVAVDAAGDLFIADYNNNVIREVSVGGVITTVAGNGTEGFSGDGGLATAAQLNLPNGVTVDAAGDLFIADYGNNVIREVSAAGVITTVAGTGAAGYTGDGGLATAAQLNQPYCVAVDAAGDLFIADTGNNVIREVSTAGVITTVAGTGGYGYSGDFGPATAAQFYGAAAVAVDACGDLFIADVINNVIREVSATGVITTVAGTGGYGYSGDGGPATAAQFRNPGNVAVDVAGDLFIADFNNNVIREVIPSLSQLSRASTTATVTSSLGSSVSGLSVTFTATVGAVAPGSGTPTGTVTFLEGRTMLGTGTLNSSGQATFTTTALSLGTHTITASYGGNRDFTGSLAHLTQQVNAVTAALSGTVFTDFNDDGQVDFGEKGISGVSITLTGTDFLGNPVNLTQTTDPDGAYIFLNLWPGNYTITETQPAGYLQGIDSLGTAGGSLAATDQFFVQLAQGVDGLNYNFGEQPPTTGGVKKGQAAGIGFWNNKNGQALILALNGGTNSTQLADWLAATLPNMFGAHAGGNNLTGKSNASVAALFQQDFLMKGVKLDAQVLATALSVYVTDSTLDSSAVAAHYGFTVSGTGLGTDSVNVGSNGDAFGAVNNTNMTVLDLLVAADAQAVNGVLYNGNTAKRNEANSLFSALNEAGGIG